MGFIVRFLLRRRIKQLQLARSELDPGGDHEALIRAFLPPPSKRLFRSYSRAKADRVRLIVIRTNIEKQLQLLDDIIASILERKSLPRQTIQGMEASVELSLDDWMETNDRYVVEPSIGYSLLVERVQELLRALDGCDSPAMQISYRRRLKYVFAEVLNVIEALFTGAS